MHIRTHPAQVAVARTIFFPLFLGVLTCSLAPLAAAQSAQGNQASARPTGIPDSLLPVPGGRFTVGLTAKEAIDLASSLQREDRQRSEYLRMLLPELGQTTVNVEPFLLSRTLVTNEQYMLFVKATNHRFPLSWWRDGQKAHHDEAREKFNTEFKDFKTDAARQYWLKYWKDLPYAIPAGLEKSPVVTISWEDAIAFAGWAGMRLPTEIEWMAAATNTGQVNQPWILGARYDEGWLETLRMKRPADLVAPKRVGEVEAASGPLGHSDMLGNVYEWTGDAELAPYGGRDVWEREYQRVKANRLGESIAMPEYWTGLRRPLKGGSYLSGTQRFAELQLRWGFRYHDSYDNHREFVGFRTAKSDAPARDMSISLLRVRYDSSDLAGRSTNLNDQIGMERYEMTPEGLIAGYHAVSVVPIETLNAARGTNAERLKEMAQDRPIPICALLTTETLSTPGLEPGLYTVYFREKGISRPFQQALREGHEILKRRKATGKDEPPKGDRAIDWKAIIDQFGITEEELLKNPRVEFITIQPGGLKIPVEQHQLLFRKTGGDFVAAMEAKQGLSIRGANRGSTIAVTKDRQNNMQGVFSFGFQLMADSRTQHVLFDLPLSLTQPADPTKPWRIAGVAPQAASGSNNTVGGSVRRSVAPIGTGR